MGNHLNHLNHLWFHHQSRVRYAETDQMGVVYHTNYLNWMEVARTEYIRCLGISYKEIEDRGLLLPVIDLEIKFRLPAYYDDVVSIYTRIADFTHLRLAFEYEIRREERQPTDEQTEWSAGEDSVQTKRFMEDDSMQGELLVTGATRHVWTGRDFKPQRLDKKAPDVFELITLHCAQSMGNR